MRFIVYVDFVYVCCFGHVLSKSFDACARRSIFFSFFVNFFGFSIDVPSWYMHAHAQYSFPLFFALVFLLSRKYAVASTGSHYH